MTLFEWQPSGAYRVAFSTRLGGVSEGAYASLNLGIKTLDEPERVVENRRRLCAAAGADPDTATMAWQVHGPRVERASPTGIVTPGIAHDRCDGLWSDEPGQAMVVVTADCLPVALAKPGAKPGSGLAILHVGWRGLLAGIVEAGARALGGGSLVAAIGPGIGRCCYEVGEDVAKAFRARFGPGVLSGRRLDLAAATERALRDAGSTEIERVGLCTACEPRLFFSHRRDGGVTGRQGAIGYVRP